MNILFLTQIVPYPPDSGPKVKTYHVLRYLAERGHRLTLATFVRQHEHKNLEGLRPYCAQIQTVPMQRRPWAEAQAYARSVFAGLPFLVARDAKEGMYGLVRQLVHDQRFDIVHADQLTMGQFALHANGARSVFDAHNAVWTIVGRSQQTAPLPLRPLLAVETRRLKAYEGRLCRSVDAVLAVSDVDRRALIEAGADGAKIQIIPIAVDCASLPALARDETSTTILTLGTLFYPPNADGIRWFMHEVYPLVKRAAASARLDIVGPRPPQDIVQFGASHPDVTVPGYVPDLQPYLQRAAVMVVPVRAASGMRVRILEALARGIPVVTTTTGVEGIDARHEEHLLLADEPDLFAAAVVRLLNNPALGRRLAANGRRLAEERYDWRQVLPRLEDVYNKIVQV